MPLELGRRACDSERLIYGDWADYSPGNILCRAEFSISDKICSNSRSASSKLLGGDCWDDERFDMPDGEYSEQTLSPRHFWLPARSGPGFALPHFVLTCSGFWPRMAMEDASDLRIPLRWRSETAAS